jgi:hypothetical protein
MARALVAALELEHDQGLEPLDLARTQRLEARHVVAGRDLARAAAALPGHAQEVKGKLALGLVRPLILGRLIGQQPPAFQFPGRALDRVFQMESDLARIGRQPGG